jgi:hypothetical protein
MKRIALHLLMLLVGMPTAFSQHLPVIRASSKVVDVRDGDHFRKGLWYIMPEKHPDHYYVEIPHKPHKVTFYTDKDSISFDARYGGKYNFVILLNGKDSCYTQLIADYRSLRNPGGLGNQPDTIPFELGDNNKIFIQASLNHSPDLKFQFDFGSDGLSIKSSTNGKVKLNQANNLRIGKLRWDSLKFEVYDRNMTRREEGLLGNSLFLDKVVELNYDKRVMVIRDSLPDISGYIKQPLVLWGPLPMIQAGVSGEKFWFIYDSGDSGQAYISADMAERYHLYDQLNPIITFGHRKVGRIEDLTIGGQHFRNLSIVMATPGTEQEYSVLGNGVLKRFNVIMDNRNGFIYLKTNGLFHEPFENTELQIYGLIAAAVIVLAVVIIIIRWLYKRREARKKLKHE